MHGRRRDSRCGLVDVFARQVYPWREAEFRGKGYMTRAVNLITDWAFDKVGAIRVIAGTFDYNEASRAVLLRAGFEREGYFKAALPGRDGTRIDDIQFVRISPLVNPS